MLLVSTIAPVMSLRAQGALIFGKTTTTEFAATGRGHPAMNPYDSSRTPGGSSSGSGAAVGDFQCTVGFGTQTIGSTIRPGSFNNIFAMKPTWNAISREGLKMLAVSLDTLGLYGRSAEDLELLLDGFRVYDDVTPTPRPISEMKIAVCKTSVWGESTVTPSLESVFQQGIDLLKAAGAEVLELDLPAEFDGALKASLNTMWTEAKSAFLGDALRCPEDLHDEFKAHVENRKGITRAEQLAGYDLLNKLMPEFDTIASKYDAILTPSVTGEAPLGIDATGNGEPDRLVILVEFHGLIRRPHTHSELLWYVDRFTYAGYQHPRIRWRGRSTTKSTVRAASTHHTILFLTDWHAHRTQYRQWQVH
jgi:Asp-tRNA(Asn)/Glu-tRNA(Gln) amidotransferase A subunit family amidase